MKYFNPFKKVFLLFISLLFFLSFCQVIVWNTKYTCSGTVVSRHDVPIPGVDLVIAFKAGAKDTFRRALQATTDSNGNFVVSGTIKSNQYAAEIFIDPNTSWQIIKDSGDYNGRVPPNGAKNFIIKLK